MVGAGKGGESRGAESIDMNFLFDGFYGRLQSQGSL